MTEDMQNKFTSSSGEDTFYTYWTRSRNLGKVKSHKPYPRAERMGNGGVDDSRSALRKLEFSETFEREVLPLGNNTFGFSEAGKIIAVLVMINYHSV